jgi:hypothetical protein
LGLCMKYGVCKLHRRSERVRFEVTTYDSGAVLG